MYFMLCSAATLTVSSNGKKASETRTHSDIFSLIKTSFSTLGFSSFHIFSRFSYIFGIASFLRESTLLGCPTPLPSTLYWPFSYSIPNTIEFDFVYLVAIIVKSPRSFLLSGNLSFVTHSHFSYRPFGLSCSITPPIKNL